MAVVPLCCLVALGAYLIGGVPFGYLIARAKGVDILKQGSGNIGATNVWRVIGARWGLLVFILDFAKGAVPVLLAYQLPPPTDLLPDTLPVLAGVMAFVGHLFPVYLGFRGGKGVATGAGVIAVLVPILTVIVLASWGLIFAVSRYVSLASLAATGLLVILRLVISHPAFNNDHLVITLFCLVGTLLVWVRHHANIRRLLAGTENRFGSPRPPG